MDLDEPWPAQPAPKIKPARLAAPLQPHRTVTLKEAWKKRDALAYFFSPPSCSDTLFIFSARRGRSGGSTSCMAL